MVSLISSMTIFGGCAKKQVAPQDTTTTEPPPTRIETPEEEEEERKPRYGSEESLETENRRETKRAGVILEGRTNSPMLPVYFDFDQSGIRGDQKTRMEQNGEFLNSNPDVRVAVEGNCDERGTNEYNLALAERRAISAEKYLTNLGIRGSRITTISYGEEKPLNFGHDELAWSQNRRDDFVVTD